MKIKKPRLLFFSIIICQLAGIIGSFATTPAIPTWYATLNKPTFNPPNWIFGPVWVTLHTLMGISLYLVWQKVGVKKEAKYSIKIFFVHLVLNSLWSIVFFGLKDLVLALDIIFAIWLLIIYLMILFWKIDKKASHLLIPYFLWVSFASILNFSIWQLN